MHRKLNLLGILFALLATPSWVVAEELKDKILHKIEEISFKSKNLVDHIKVEEKTYKANLTFDASLEKYIYRLLRRYRSDYTSVVVMDNKTGKLLSGFEWERNHKEPKRYYTYRATHPAASIFKIVTAADLIENTHVNHKTEFIFNGKSTTLYKSQLRNRVHRWSRKINLEKAFARSNNVIFGKAAVENLSASGLKKMANNFGFNRSLADLYLEKSIAPEAENQYNLAELATGFNKKTLASPVHGALMASVAANQGILKKPIFIDSIEDSQGKIIWKATEESTQALQGETSENLKNLMKTTVKVGTARRAFRRGQRKIRDIEIGGKTGTLTGGEPMGRRDWFVAYAKEKGVDDPGISICVMIINKKKWYVKSSFIAREIIEYYFNQ